MEGCKCNREAKKCQKCDCVDLREIGLKWFKISEFDSPDEPGSGSKMCCNFLIDLDEARDRAGVPFRINSGYRTEHYNDKVLGARVGSSHKKGLAADIGYKGNHEKYKILSALMSVGFCRIGLGKSFIHVDCDTVKSKETMWSYEY